MRFYSDPEAGCAMMAPVRSVTVRIAVRRILRADYFFFCSSGLESFKHRLALFPVWCAILWARRWL
jgi:hypothetical protein